MKEHKGQYKATPQYKTVYDPEIISDLEFMNRGFEAFQNALSENPNLPRQWFAPDNNGLEWTGFTNSAGEPTNFSQLIDYGGKYVFKI